MFKNSGKRGQKTESEKNRKTQRNHLRIKAKKMEPTLGIEPRTCSLRGIIYYSNISFITSSLRDFSNPDLYFNLTLQEVCAILRERNRKVEKESISVR